MVSDILYGKTHKDISKKNMIFLNVKQNTKNNYKVQRLSLYGSTSQAIGDGSALHPFYMDDDIVYSRKITFNVNRKVEEY